MKRLFLLAVLAINIGMVVMLPSAMAQQFPLTIEHKFGTTVIPAKPTRIASVDYGGQDNLLALGVQPVVMRYWWGDHPYGVWKWAEPYFKSEPVLLKGDLDFEAIAATKPDVIIALYSGIDDAVYKKLSLIAPVVAVPEGVADYGMAWDKRALLTGRAIGLEGEAKTKIQSINEKLADAAKSHPEWQGKTLAIGSVWSEGVSAYTASDPRSQLLGQLGFVTTPEVDALAATDPSAFYVMISEEDPSPLDADLLVWVTDENEEKAEITALAMYPFIKATQENRDLFLNRNMSGALSHASLLSLPYAIDILVPAIVAALDGDPATIANAD